MLTVEERPGPGGDEELGYVLRSPASLFYANPRFIGLVARHLEARAGWLVARRHGRLAGLLPFVAKTGPLGEVRNSLAYYGSHGGVIQAAPDEEAKLALVRAFYSAPACSATIVANPLEADDEFYRLHSGYTDRDERISQVSHLPTARLQDPRPRNLRHARKLGVQVEETRSLDFLVVWHEENLRALGGRPKARTFFEAVERELEPGDWRVFQARWEGRPVAALLLFYFNRTVEYYTPVLVPEHRSTQALSLVIWEAMEEARSAGYELWNWGGTWLSQRGVYDFKRRWGARESRYGYYTKVSDESLRKRAPEYLLEHYRGLYVIPFHA